MIRRQNKSTHQPQQIGVPESDGLQERCNNTDHSRMSMKKNQYTLIQWIWQRTNIMHIQSRVGGIIHLSCCLLLLVLTCVIILQINAFVSEYQGPLDHVATSIVASYYRMYCPHFSLDDHVSSTNVISNKILIPCDCNEKMIDIKGNSNSVTGKKNELNVSESFPRVFMIGARDKDEDTFGTWEQILQTNQTTHNDDYTQAYQYNIPRLERINTLRISNQYALSGGATVSKNRNDMNTNSTIESTEQKHFLCRKMKWEHRLFAVYQSVFANLLAIYPNDTGFVIVEDDAVLKNPNAFVQEVCNAHYLQLGFYSLYRSPLQTKGRSYSSCIYIHGTVAFYIQKSIMEKIVNERRRGHFCRFPIDMYISKLGPWYATRRDIVGHLDVGGRVGST